MRSAAPLAAPRRIVAWAGYGRQDTEARVKFASSRRFATLRRRARMLRRFPYICAAIFALVPRGMGAFRFRLVENKAGKISGQIRIFERGLLIDGGRLDL